MSYFARALGALFLVSIFMNQSEVFALSMHADELHQWSATPSEIRKAGCVSERLSTDELYAWLELNRRAEDLAPLVNELGGYLSEQSDLTALEEIQEIYGEEEGLKILYIRSKFGFNTTPYAGKESLYQSFPRSTRKRFTSRELDTVIRTLESFPRGYYASRDGRPLMRVDFLGQKTIANAVITLSDNWSSQLEELQMYTLTHELGHNFDKDLTASMGWRSLSAWAAPFDDFLDEINRPWQHMRRSLNSRLFVSSYSMENPSEDWAESVAAYRFNPSRLMSAHPKKFNTVMMLAFHGHSFWSNNRAEQCERPTRCERSYEDAPRKLLAKMELGSYRIPPVVQVKAWEQFAWKDKEELRREMISLILEEEQSGDLRNWLRGFGFSEEMQDEGEFVCRTNYRFEMQTDSELEASIERLVDQQLDWGVSSFESFCRLQVEQLESCADIEGVVESLFEEHFPKASGLEKERMMEPFLFRGYSLDHACRDLCFDHERAIIGQELSQR